MFKILSILILTALGSASLYAQTPPEFPAPPDPANPTPSPGDMDELVTVQLPDNPVIEVLGFYEALTGRRILRDSNLAGPNISVQVPGQIPKKDAIALIESALLLNGYSVVPLDDKTSKVLGQGRSPLGESIPLYADPFLLPDTEELVSYFMLLNYISPQDALQVFTNYVAPRYPIVPVPNSNALVITDTSTLVRRLVTLQRFIDVPGARILTEFVPLMRADAERVAELVNTLLTDENPQNQGRGTAQAITENQQAQQQQQQAEGAPPVPPPPTGGTTAPGAIQQLNALIKILPDTRTNRILVVAPENRMPYLQDLIRDLDSAVSLDTALERPLQFVSAGEILPVLESILAEGSDAEDAAGQGAGDGQGSDQNQRPGSGSGSADGGTQDLLSEPTADTSPLAASVGKARIIADRSANQIIVLGPPEIREKAARVLDMLDQRPKQIYLACVIGQLTLDNNLEVGFDYLMRFQSTPDGTGIGGVTRNGAVNLLPGVSSLITNDAIVNATSALSGLTVFGSIAETVDIYAKFLQQNANFEVLSRPIVYTANNKLAEITSGQEIPFAGSTISSVVSGDGNQDGATTALNSTVEFKKVELKIEVIPLINSDDEVTLQIGQQNNNVIQFEEISGNRVPVIGTQTLYTTITVKDQETIVLGGLITEEDNLSRNGIPLLMDIPALGYLFSNSRKEKVRRELIVLIQPYIISDESDLAIAQDSLREVSKLDDQVERLDGSTIRRAEPVAPFPQAPIR